MYVLECGGEGGFVYAWDFIVVEGQNKSRVGSKFRASESQRSGELSHFVSTLNMRNLAFVS